MEMPFTIHAIFSIMLLAGLVGLLVTILFVDKLDFVHFGDDWINLCSIYSAIAVSGGIGMALFDYGYISLAIVIVSGIGGISVGILVALLLRVFRKDTRDKYRGKFGTVCQQIPAIGGHGEIELRMPDGTLIREAAMSELAVPIPVGKKVVVYWVDPEYVSVIPLNHE